MFWKNTTGALPHGSASKKLTLATIPLFFAISCATVPLTSVDAGCDATRQTRAAHANALANTADTEVLRTGAALIAQVDAWCA